MAMLRMSDFISSSYIRSFNRRPPPHSHIPTAQSNEEYPVISLCHSGKGFCKVKKCQKIQNKTWIELTPPPPIQTIVFGNPSLTWIEHSNQNNPQLLAMYIQTEYTWYTTPKYQYWFRAIFGMIFQNKTKSE